MRKIKVRKSTLRAALYISIASFTALMSDLAGFKSFSEISSVGAAIIAINFLLQGLIAWRAFLDQTLTDDKREDKENDNIQKLYRTPRPVELILEDTK